MRDLVSIMFLAFVRAHILHHAAEGQVCGAEMIGELGRHGYRLSPGTLYPIFHSLEKAGYLVSSSAVVNGKQRKNHRITRKGRRALAQLRVKLDELAGELLEYRRQQASPRKRR